MLRVIVTLLVVVGHCYYYSISTQYGGCDYSSLVGEPCVVLEIFHKIKVTIYLFHMPLFMALSGALFKKQLDRNRYSSFSALVIKKGKKLMIPFLFVSICYSIPIKIATGYYASSSNLLKDIVVGQLFIQGNTYLWYLLTLLVVFMLAYLLEQRLHLSVALKMALLLILCVMSGMIEAKIISYVMDYCFWFYIGFYFEHNRNNINSYLSGKTLIFFLFLFMLFCYIYMTLDGSDLPFSIIYKINEVVLGFIGCLLTYNAAYLMTGTKVANLKLCRIVQKDSFGIYLYSDPLNYIILAISASAFGSQVFGNNLGILCLATVRFSVTLIISVFLTELLIKLGLKYLH